MAKKKWFLYITSFLAGLSIMAVEIAASRLLSPFFSSSQIVWTMIIGTIMIALAVGNIWGGRSAAKDPNPGKLYLRLIIAAAWISLIPLVGKYIIAGISLLLATFVSGNYLIWSSLITCLVLFFFPLMLLGTTTPSLTRYTVQNVEESGLIVGRLSALNTVGSIIGTFLPTFVTIPLVGTSLTFIIFAVILLALGLTYFIVKAVDDHKNGDGINKKEVISSSIGAGLAILFTVAQMFTPSRLAFWDGELIYEGESMYNYLRVTERADGRRYLSTNVMVGMQSAYYPTIGFHGAYYDTAVMAPMFVPLDVNEDLDVLMLGLGTGTYSKYLYHYYSDYNVNIDGIEIDGAIIDLAYKYFDLDPEVNVYEEDGRAFLEYGAGKNKMYDIIFVDAYEDISIPFQMSSVEFMEIIAEHLNENGMVMLNMNMRSNKKGSINDYLIDTVATQFKKIYTALGGSSNRLLFASKNENVLLEVVRPQIDALEEGPLKVRLNRVYDNLITPEIGNLILTDDKAPVEVLSMRVLDDFINEQLEVVRKGIKEKGFLDFIREYL